MPRNAYSQKSMDVLKKTYLLKDDIENTLMNTVGSNTLPVLPPGKNGEGSGSSHCKVHYEAFHVHLLDNIIPIGLVTPNVID